MNIQEYRESKINKYPDRKTGLLMYRHEKLYDIVKTIEDFVNVSFGKVISKEKYIESYEEMITKLPKSYKNECEGTFLRFITLYERANMIIQKNKDNEEPFTKTKDLDVEREYHYLKDYLKNKGIDVHKKKLKRYGGAISIIMSEAEQEQIDSDTRGVYNKQIHSIFIKKNKRQSQNNTLKHEHFHHLANMGLINEIKSDDEYNINTKSVVYHQIKNELIAQYSVEKDFLEDIGFSLNLERYIIKYLGKDYNEEKIERYKNNTKERRRIIQQFTSGRLYSKIVPRYFESRNQILYLLAITPLSQRQSLLDYYKKLNSLYQTPSDLHSILSAPHDQPPL